MWFQRILFLVCCVVVYGDYIISRPKETKLEIPEYLEEFEKLTFPKGSYGTRLVRAERAIAKPKALKLIFHLPPEKSDEITMEKCIFLYLPHRENATNYTVNIRNLFTGRVIAYKFLPIQKSSWHKVSLNRWPEDSERRLGLILANQGLEIRLEEKGGGKFDFEEFYKSNENSGHKFVPSLLIYHQNKKPNSLEDFFNIKKENSGKTLELPAKDGLPSELSANPRRMRRSTSSTSCSYTIQDMYNNLNLTTIKLVHYSPNTTKICTGNCTPLLSTSSKCDKSVQDCCVPSKRRAFYIMMYMGKTAILVLRKFPDMIVEECACASSINNKRIAGQGNGNKG